jgi:hypothetical protein
MDVYAESETSTIASNRNDSWVGNSECTATEESISLLLISEPISKAPSSEEPISIKDILAKLEGHFPTDEAILECELDLLGVEFPII